MIQTPEPEDLFRPENLQRIEAAQRFVETLPHVKGTVSIVDFLKQMNRSMNENRRDAYRLPTDADLVAQYFLLYSASGDPTDFEEYVDYDYRLANLRARLNTGRYSDIKGVVEAAERYIREDFNAPGITASLAGRVNVDYHWINRLGNSHFFSLGLALAAVWLMASLSFRSAMAGTLAVVPVWLALLLIYAIMGFNGIWLGIGTSMFAAIAIGTSVDFSVHTLDRLMVLTREKRQTLDEAFITLFPSTGRAFLFSFLALFLGFGVLTASQVPPLIRFGGLVGVSAVAGFSASLTVMPALTKVLRPAFLGLKREPIRVRSYTETAPAVALNEN